MIVLDTNVIAAVMRATPEQAVVTWLDAQPSESVWTTAVTVFEIRYGLCSLPPGRRRQALEEAFDEALEQDLEGRVLDFDRSRASCTVRIGLSALTQSRARHTVP